MDTVIDIFKFTSVIHALNLYLKDAMAEIKVVPPVSHKHATVLVRTSVEDCGGTSTPNRYKPCGAPAPDT